MDKETFEKLMYEEWKKNTLDLYSQEIENDHFNKLWELRSRLYDFFYPLNIHGKGIHDVAAVSSDISYSKYDDGDLSIVVAYLDINDEFANVRLDKFLEEHNLPKVKKLDFITKVFVMRGYYTELYDDSVKKYALQHSSGKATFVRYVAKRFSTDVLYKLHNLLPRFEKENDLSNSRNVIGYFEYSKETEKILEQLVLDL